MKTKRMAKVESHTLAGMDKAVEEQSFAAAVYSGEELTAAMREPLKDISRDSGEMERESPLFFGTGDNPQLF